MILQRLAQYYDRLARAGSLEVPRRGFQKKEIPFVIVLDRDGRFKGIDDTRTEEGRVRRGRVFEVPHEVKRSGKNAWKESNLLWDNVTYVLGYSVDNSKAAKRKHGVFIKKIKEVFPNPQIDVGIQALLSFLYKRDFSAIRHHPLWKDMEKSGGNISFRLEKDDQLICQREKIVKQILSLPRSGYETRRICLISGKEDVPVRLHTAIKGVRGAQSSGGNIVSFNLPAFNSYGWDQGLNAPVGENAEFAYTTALNYLLARGSKQKMLVGESTAVFWAKEEHPIESWFAGFLSEDWQGSDQENETIKALHESPLTGKLPVLEDLTPFHIVGLSPNASRLAIRFWYEGTVGETVRHILEHFEDCRIVHSPKQPDRNSIFRLLLSIAPQQKSDNIQPNLSGDIIFSILKARPYPRTLLSSGVRRCRAEQNVTYERASLIKAVLVREARFYKRDVKEVDMALDKTNPSEGYRLGRLFAVLEKIQEEASPGINATIRDRYYGAASSIPVTVFRTLLKLKNHHLAKLENRGRAVNLERTISEIIGGIANFPPHLTLDEQGRFAIGYYHQRADLFSSKNKTEKEV
jgi:CRISPR-associated protein Csd1